MTATVIDVSSWNHPNNAPIDWAQVKESGIVGVIVKATQSTNYTNPFYKTDAESAASVGLLVGAYHYAQPGGPSAQDQAAYFHEIASAVACPLGYWLDLEETDGKGWQEVGAFANEWVAALNTPVTPAGVYVDQSFWESLSYQLQGVRLWLVTVDGQTVPAGASPSVVQTGQSTVPGIVGNVDHDIWLNARGLNLPGPAVPTPPAPAPAAPWTGIPSIRLGSTGPNVRWVQERLNAYGAHLAVDSAYGTQTDSEVEAFQRWAHLAVDGVVGPVTYAILAKTPPGDVLGTPPEPAEPEVAQGATGDTVRLVQQKLTVHGIPTTVDGIFGPMTEANVRSFQAAAGVTVDGVVGPNTWHALLA